MPSKVPPVALIRGRLESLKQMTSRGLVPAEQQDVLELLESMLGHIEQHDLKLAMLADVSQQHTDVFNNHHHHGSVDKGDPEYSGPSVTTEGPIRPRNMGYGGTGEPLRMKPPMGDMRDYSNDEDEEVRSVFDTNLDVVKAFPGTGLTAVLAWLRDKRIVHEAPQDWEADDDDRRQRLSMETGPNKFVTLGEDVRFLIFSRGGDLVAVEDPGSGSLRLVKNPEGVEYVKNLVRRLRTEDYYLDWEDDEDPAPPVSPKKTSRKAKKARA